LLSYHKPMFDTHCHLIDPQFEKDLDAVIQRAQAAGVSRIINAGYDLKTSRLALEQSRKYSLLLPAIGIHPNDAAGELMGDLSDIEDIPRHERIYAIGETGLDYYRDITSREAQQKLFRRHIDIARKFNLPLLIHTRNSVQDAIEILKQEQYGRGVFHCYSGTLEQAKVITSMGFYLGFGGMLTFSKKTREVFREIPLDRIVFETDAPFLSPSSYRGKRNEPAYIKETVSAGALLQGITEEKIMQTTDMNAHYLFV
jgi:TatD DNase family protein